MTLPLNNNESNLIDLQNRMRQWAIDCFGEEVAFSAQERNLRFIEEALELAQSTGFTKHDAHNMVEYVFNREKGEPIQEAGGAFLTLIALCNAHQINLESAGEKEFQSISENILKIREKHKQKPNTILKSRE